jgi:hypothetical protein
MGVPFRGNSTQSYGLMGWILCGLTVCASPAARPIQSLPHHKTTSICSTTADTTPPKGGRVQARVSQRLLLGLLRLLIPASY